MKTLKISLFVLLMLTLNLAHSQDKKQTKVKQTQTEKAAYTCPMHADVKSDKPGACPKCGMELTKMEVAKNHQCCAGMKMDSTKTGMKCDSTIMGMKHDSMDMNHKNMANNFTCPMHSDIKSDKPGECPKCGMELKEKKMDTKKEHKL
ncbi:MAG: hypothetical protein CVU08_13760 [Bacteroidetes bacterium HGW-Bacteroidetes-3]|jgi:predicted Zn-ribbon and HTH transcriptional regulator|nr:MAG: hypothetical protein CVU08_13760 [Bacteroidetes bacterium HGW-Bacteroidetes-3]